MNYNFDNENSPVQIIAIDSLAFYKLFKMVSQKLQEEQGKKKEWLTGAECMAMLHIRRTTLSKLRMSGAISYSKFGKKILYHTVSVEQYLRENTQEKF